MELYLKWLNRYEKMEGENHPIGLMLCTEASSKEIELLEMHKDGIVVAEYMTELPPKKQLEQKIQTALNVIKWFIMSNYSAKISWFIHNCC